MREQMEARLKALRDEFQSGRQMLADLEARQAQLQTTLARISGAIQVLEELMAAPPQPPVPQPRELEALGSRLPRTGDGDHAAPNDSIPPLPILGEGARG